MIGSTIGDDVAVREASESVMDGVAVGGDELERNLHEW